MWETTQLILYIQIHHCYCIANLSVDVTIVADFMTTFLIMFVINVNLCTVTRLKKGLSFMCQLHSHLTGISVLNLFVKINLCILKSHIEWCTVKRRCHATIHIEGISVIKLIIFLTPTFFLRTGHIE